jgi:hypothetical protein
MEVTNTAETSEKNLRSYNAGVFNLNLLKGHILMAEIFAGRIHVLQGKVCILLQDMRTNLLKLSGNFTYDQV